MKFSISTGFGFFLMLILSVFFILGTGELRAHASSGPTKMEFSASSVSNDVISAVRKNLVVAADVAPAPQPEKKDYPRIKGVNGRLFVWLAAQMHLWLAAFVLAVPVFVMIIEAIGVVTNDERFDAMAYEFIRISITAYSLTAVSGGILVAGLITFYPHLFHYMTGLFRGAILAYGALIVAESTFLYLYYYGWDRLKRGYGKYVHLVIGLMLNLTGTAIMFIANAWATFMMSPAGVDAEGRFFGNSWAVINNHLWHPLNIHRLVANIAYGGSIIGAYAAYRFICSESKELRAYYDWMGYYASFIAIVALLPLPFAGYYLTLEIYRYSQQMAITLMGGVFAWLFIIQAVIIGVLFLSINYYLWCSLSRSKNAAGYLKYIKYLAFVIIAAFLVWFTPHTLILTNEELKRLGGTYHRYLGPLGLMPAKNTAVNIIILFTYLSFMIYRRCNREPALSRKRKGNAVQAALFCAGIVNILMLGIYYGYFTDTQHKVGASVPQVATTFFVIVASMIIDKFIYTRSEETAPLRWGNVPARAQYSLILLAVSYTWLMGLMGFVRSGIRQHWHVVGIMQDNSENAFIPPLGYAANIVSLGTVIFMALIIFVFWLGGPAGRGDAGQYNRQDL